MRVNNPNNVVTLLKLAGLCLFATALVGCSRAHIIVIDQHDKPIEDVLVRSNIQPGNAFFFSDEATVGYTDEEGKVSLPVGRWFEINLVEKKGYQFRPFAQFKQEFGDYAFGRYAERFTSDNPLVIRGWKRGEQPKLTYVGGKFVFPDNIEQCTLELVKPTTENGLKMPLVWTVQMETKFVKDPENPNPNQRYDADRWRSRFMISGTGLQDTNDLFLNKAPRNGYNEAVVYPFDKFPSSMMSEKHVFAKSAKNEYFGAGLIFFRPDRGTKASLDEVNKHIAYFQFWFNFDGSTNIMRSKNRTTWTDLNWQMDEQIYCREAPRFVDD